MYTTTLNEFKTQQDELFRQAENYRLMKSIESKKTSISKFIGNIGKVIDQLISL
jgi:hypothetical protein